MMLTAILLCECEWRLLVPVECLQVLRLLAMFNKNLGRLEVSVLAGDVEGRVLRRGLLLVGVGATLQEDVHDAVELLLRGFE